MTLSCTTSSITLAGRTVTRTACTHLPHYHHVQKKSLAALNYIHLAQRHRSFHNQRSFASNTNGSSHNNANGSQDIIDSTAATTTWKRSQYQKLTQKFSPIKTPDEPLQIDNYEDVQPMWKQMESRVTRRRSLTREERGGISGRRNVRRSDEDLWLEAGVYDEKDDEKK